MRIINTVLLVLILVVAGGTAAFYYFSSSRAAAPEVEVIPSPEPVATAQAPIYLPLDPFTVTIESNRNNQILYTEITLRVENMQAHSQLMQYMPEVRSRILIELAQHSASELQKGEGRSDLAQRLGRLLSEPYNQVQNGPAILSVLFTAFVIQ